MARTSWRQWFVLSPQAYQRGQPAPLAPVERRPYAAMLPRKKQGLVFRVPTREYTRPLDSEAWIGGYIDYNPIGAGVVFTKALPIHQDGVRDPNTGQYYGQTGDYVPGLGIVWGSQTPINNGLQPQLGPLYTPQQVYALIGDTNAEAAAPAPAFGPGEYNYTT